MTRIDVLCGEPQFIDHCAPVFLALPPENRGDFIVVKAGSTEFTLDQLEARARSRGVEPSRSGDRSRPVLVASWGDYKRVRKERSRIIRMEHGIGQSFRDITHPSYAGGSSAEDVGLFLTPNEHSADRWRQAYPSTPVAVVGSPHIDTLPKRKHSIGVESLGWDHFDAGIRPLLRMFARTPTDGVVCVAHAIADVSPNGHASGRSPAIPVNLNMTELDISESIQTPQNAQLDRVESLIEAVKSAMSECTSSFETSCLRHAISAVPPNDLRLHSAGIRLTNAGSSVTEESLTLEIPTTTFGSVSLVMSTTTAKAISLATVFTQAAGREPPVISTSFHWGMLPSKRSPIAEQFGSFNEYASMMRPLADHFTVLGHGHPRDIRRFERVYRRAGIETVRDFDEVCERADLFVIDTNSCAFEFASTGRPVVLVNGKHFRRDVEHGLRFWAASGVGVNCNSPAELIPAVRLALEDKPAQRKAREKALDIVYKFRSGAASRAAAAIVEWVDGILTRNVA